MNILVFMYNTDMQLLCLFIILTCAYILYDIKLALPSMNQLLVFFLLQITLHIKMCCHFNLNK